MTFFAIISNNVRDTLLINGQNECPFSHFESAIADVSFDSINFFSKVLTNNSRGLELFIRRNSRLSFLLIFL